MKDRSKQQNEALFGPSAKSDYDPGDSVQFVEGVELASGTVIMTRATGEVYEGGPVLKAGHIVDSGRGWPRYVPLKRVVE